jgi:ERCC4-type nuclease
MLLLSTYDAACVVVEADLDAMLRGVRGDDLRGAKPESVLGACLHITLRYGVPVFWCGSRQAARTFTEMYLRMAVRQDPCASESTRIRGL